MHSQHHARQKSLKVTTALTVLAVAMGFGMWLLWPFPAALSQKIPPKSNATIQEYPQGPLARSVQFDKLLVEKAQRRMTAYSNNKPVRIYTVSLGDNPIGPKQFEGDEKTPEGAYTIDGKNPHSSYYKNLGISYPNAADKKFAKSKGKRPGGAIKIHGLAPHFQHIGALHRLEDWTDGCIAVTNEEMEELYTRTPVGIPIHIRP